jgi:hypothetical protein
MIELRWNGDVLEQRTRFVCVDAAGAFCEFTEWSAWHPVPRVEDSVEPVVGPNIPKTLPVQEEQ